MYPWGWSVDGCCCWQEMSPNLKYLTQCTWHCSRFLLQILSAVQLAILDTKYVMLPKVFCFKFWLLPKLWMRLGFEKMFTTPKRFASSKYSLFPSKIQIQSQIGSIPPTFQNQYGSLDVRFWVYANTLHKKACESGIRFFFSFSLL